MVTGARFIDRFLPMQGKELSSDTWGADYVLPRYIDNGIEDRIWSYWGGNIIKSDDNKYHLMVCGWLESSKGGHTEWPHSYVFNTVSDYPTGPFKLRNMIGKGHNPEIFRLKDGRYVLYVINGRYVSDKLNGKWEYGEFDFNPRDRKIIEGMSNLSFAQREDGSFLMVCRGGGIWISRDGLSEYNQITDRHVYPDVDGRFEDPVIWRDHIQYNMIVNDWLGRIAYYLRSKDGIEWVVDPGEAYTPGIAAHEDGLVENWFKFERMKVYQDEYGRAVQANFAVIDTIKWEDKSSDNHSSKNIGIPLNPGLLLEVLNEKPIREKTKNIRLRIKAEKGFNPQTDINLSSLRLGASQEVNYGRGCKMLNAETEGNDLIVSFDGKSSGITKAEFTFKLIGKYNNGKMLYGYARLPGIDYITPLLSACAPRFEKTGEGSWQCDIEVQNFGQIASCDKTSIKIERIDEAGNKKIMASGKIPVLQTYESVTLSLKCKNYEEKKEWNTVVTITSEGRQNKYYQYNK